MGKNIVITIPSNIPWGQYESEFKLVSDGNKQLNFKVNNFPINSEVGDRCYVCYSGNILGYMNITGFEEKEFICKFTDKKWKGKFIQRSGKFYSIDPIPMKGFQGFRYVDF